MKGYKEILLGNTKAPKTSVTIDKSTENGKGLLRLRQLNEAGYNDPLLSCMDKVNFGAVDEACNTDFPDSDSKLAWDNLIAKYEPKTPALLVQLKLEFAENRLLDIGKDLDEWISSLERLR